MKKEIRVKVTEANDRYVIVEARIIEEETAVIDRKVFAYIAAANVCTGDVAQAVDEAAQKALAGAKKLADSNAATEEHEARPENSAFPDFEDDDLPFDIPQAPVVTADFKPFPEAFAEEDDSNSAKKENAPEAAQEANASVPVQTETENTSDEKPEVSDAKAEEQEGRVAAVKSVRRKGRRFGESAQPTESASLSVRKDERISDCQPVNTADEARVVLCPFRKYKGMGIGQIASTFNGKQYIASIAGDSPLWDEIIVAYPNFRDACKKFCDGEGIEPISDWGKN